MRRATPFILVPLLLLIAIFANISETAAYQEGDNIFFSGEIVGPDIVVTGAPYTAEGVIENVQVLADGNRIVHTTTQLVARDSKGRVRREMKIDFIGPIEVKGPREVLINDPVLDRQIFLNVDTKVATVRSRHFFRLVSPDEAKSEKSKEKKPPENKDAQSNARHQVDDAQSESLGTKIIEGLSVKGMINKWTIPKETIGNSQPINVSVESWYSPDLQIEIIRHRIDPRFGDNKFTLTHIQRTEPKASLFTIPAGYKIIRAR